jgi:hypothetical protein
VAGSRRTHKSITVTISVHRAEDSVLFEQEVNDRLLVSTEVNSRGDDVRVFEHARGD